MMSQVKKLLLLILVCVTTDGKQFPDDTDGSQEYTSSDIYNRVNLQSKDYGFESTCPAAVDIAPCVCIAEIGGNALDLDCSAIENEEQFRNIFLFADFPTKKFRDLRIYENSNLKVLEPSVFNGISFETLALVIDELEVISPKALDSCYKTTDFIDLAYCKLTSFPFDELSQFSKLTFFSVVHNSLRIIPAEAFNGITTLEELGLDGNAANITGNFENLPNLMRIGLGYNALPPIIPNKFINTLSSKLEYIGMDSSHIKSVEPGAFDIVEGMFIDMSSNSLTTLDEETWQPILKVGGTLNFNDNPLSCGCDIAWLFKEDFLIGQLDSVTTCVNGENIHNLDPSIFEDC